MCCFGDYDGAEDLHHDHGAVEMALVMVVAKVLAREHNACPCEIWSFVDLDDVSCDDACVCLSDDWKSQHPNLSFRSQS